jgi:hypothetical protein
MIRDMTPRGRCGTGCSIGGRWRPGDVIAEVLAHHRRGGQLAGSPTGWSDDRSGSGIWASADGTRQKLEPTPPSLAELGRAGGGDLLRGDAGALANPAAAPARAGAPPWATRPSTPTRSSPDTGRSSPAHRGAPAPRGGGGRQADVSAVGRAAERVDQPRARCGEVLRDVSLCLVASCPGHQPVEQLVSTAAPPRRSTRVRRVRRTPRRPARAVAARARLIPPSTDPLEPRADRHRGLPGDDVLADAVRAGSRSVV